MKIGDTVKTSTTGSKNTGEILEKRYKGYSIRRYGQGFIVHKFDINRAVWKDSTVEKCKEWIDKRTKGNKKEAAQNEKTYRW